MTGHSRRLEAAVYCHLGGGRSNNEDNYYLNGAWKSPERQDQNCAQACSALPPALFAVCDGMGGAQHGEVASRLAVSWLHRCRTDFLEGAQPETSGVDTLVRLSRKFWRVCRERGVHMGSTVAALAVCREQAYAFGLGDSRIYLLDQSGLCQLTQDHTLAAEAEWIGLTGGARLPATDPRSHQLTQYFGMDCFEYDPSPCCRAVPLHPGQRFLLCSDGLSDCLDGERLLPLLARGTPSQSAHSLVTAALEQGAADNITAMVLQIV